MPSNIHPLLVHFPIALLLSYVALDWGGRIWKGKALTEASWYTLLLGLAGTVVTLITDSWRLAAFPLKVQPLRRLMCINSSASPPSSFWHTGILLRAQPGQVHPWQTDFAYCYPTGWRRTNCRHGLFWR
ncbi:MAG: hypothetical protein HC806_03260 [Anaerolineae bacterium]|nr:hypothetical protein [Anaerolineae bacterium]